MLHVNNLMHNFFYPKHERLNYSVVVCVMNSIRERPEVCSHVFGEGASEQLTETL